MAGLKYIIILLLLSSPSSLSFDIGVLGWMLARDWILILLAYNGHHSSQERRWTAAVWIRIGPYHYLPLFLFCMFKDSWIKRMGWWYFYLPIFTCQRKYQSWQFNCKLLVTNYLICTCRSSANVKMGGIITDFNLLHRLDTECAENGYVGFDNDNDYKRQKLCKVNKKGMGATKCITANW